MPLPSYLPLLVDLLLKSIAVLAVALFVAHLFRRASAANRHVIWLAAFAVLWALPVVSLVVREGAETTNDEVAAVVLRLPATEVSAAAPVTGAGSGTVVARVGNVGGVPDWRTLVAGVWLGGMALLVAARLAGTVRLWALRFRSRTVCGGRLADACARVAADCGIRRPVMVRVSRACRVALTWGTWRPVVLLPEDAEGWAEERLECVLRHELAHVKRMDCLARFFVQLACALYWPNPLVWMAARRARLAQEQACDDRVLAAGVGSEAYALELVAAVRELNAAVRMGGAVAMAEPSTLEHRVLAITDEGRARGALRRSSVMVAMTCVAAALVGCSQVAVRNASKQVAPTKAEEVSGALVEIVTRFVEIAGGGEDEKALEALLGDTSRRGEGKATIAGFLSSEQMNEAFGAMGKIRRADILRAPSVTVRSGNQARVDVGQELRYPIRWKIDPEGSGWLPVEYETRTVGVEINVTPRVKADGGIELDLRPRVTEFEGFVDYAASPVDLQITQQTGEDGRVRFKVERADGKTAEAETGTGGASDEAGSTRAAAGERSIVQPVFAVRAVQAVVPRLVSGQTVVIRVGERKQTAAITDHAHPSEGTVEAKTMSLLVFVTATVK